ncbi:MAG: GntR family transcriptional regulator [Kiritimatiellae bacterium]|nr:GntR family transcriptional regulator [Kiritimatiellia bacterium]
MKVTSKHVELQERLKADILRGKYAEKLPNIRTLGEIYAVNFKTANKAVSALVHDGLLYRQRGKGTFVVRRKGARSGTLGLFFTWVPHAIAGTVALFENITAVLSQLRDKPYTLTMRPMSEGLPADAVQAMALRETETMDGAFLIGAGKRLVDIFHRTGFPYVALYADRDEPNFNGVDSDDRAGAFEMTEHLIGLGHRRIAAVLGQTNYAGYRLRLQGFREAFARHGLPVDESLVKAGGSGWESGYRAMNDLLRGSQRPSAVFCFSDFRAIGAMECAREKGLRVPDDIAVVGFDGIQAARGAKPALTTVVVARDEIARTGLEMLVSWVSDADYVPHRKLVRPRLMIADSATPANGADTG